MNADVFKVHDEAFYTEPVLSGDVLYNSIFDTPSKYRVGRGETYVRYPAFDRIVARDMSQARWRLALSADHLVRQLEFPVIWELATPHKVLIASGDKVVAGTPGEIITIKPPAEAGQAPRISFKGKIDGAPVHALVSHGRLIVSTNTGKLYCFATGKASSLADVPVQRASVFGKTHAPSFPQGYALILGWGKGKQVERLLKEGAHQIVVLEPDKDLADRQRQALAAKGVYGRQIQIVTAEPQRMLLSKYWANLVVSDDLTPFSASLLEQSLEAVRPYTGRLTIPATDKAAPVLEKAVAERKEFVSRSAGSQLEFHRISPPQGYDDWTHETAGPGNTFANRDALVKAPLGLLWFSGYIDRFYTPEFHFQHDRAPYPLISDGRMFLITGKYMNAVDAYTGNFLWKIEMPMTQRVKWCYMDSRVYSRPYERNYIATSDTLYIIYEQEIHLISTATGEQFGVFTIPDEIASAVSDSIWTEVRLADDSLCCVVGNTLACLDRTTGKLLWQRASRRDGSTYALTDTALYGVDYKTPPNIFRGETTARKESTLFRLDLRTGKENWSVIVDHATVPEQNPKQKKLWLLPITPAVIFNSVRAGCTANFLPAGGILNAPSFGHGCVCNYPTFASLALVHLPEVDTFKPAIVKASEMQRSKPAADSADPIQTHSSQK